MPASSTAPSTIPSTTLRARAPRLAEAAVERARLTVVPRTQTRAARMPFVSLVTLLLLGGVVGLLLFNTSMQQSSFTATALEQRAMLLSARQESLGLQLERLREPQVIARRAQKLGMRLPAAPLFLDLSDGSIEGDVAGAQVLATVLLDPRPAARPAQLDPPPAVVRPPEGELSGGRGAGAEVANTDPKQNEKKHESKNDKKRKNKVDEKRENEKRDRA